MQLLARRDKARLLAGGHVAANPATRFATERGAFGRGYHEVKLTHSAQDLRAAAQMVFDARDGPIVRVTRRS